jgi:hypothetical protein
MQIVITVSSCEHAKAVQEYAARTATPGQHVDVPVVSTPQGNGQPVATYTGPLHAAPVQAAGPVDGRGVVWNGDFHASTKTQTLKGAWKARKGRDETAAQAYEASHGAVTPGVPVQAAPAVTVPAGTTFPIYPTPAAPAFSFGAPVGPSPVGCTPQEFMTMANHLMGQGKLDNAKVMQMCQEAGIADPNTLAVDDMGRAKIYGRLMALAAG